MCLGQAHWSDALLLKPRRQVGVGDKELAESYRIRLTCLDDLIRLCQRVSFIRDVYSAELPFELWTQSVGSEVLRENRKPSPRLPSSRAT